MQEVFDRWSVVPHTVVYEDLIASFEPTVRDILGFLELPGRDSVPIPTPPSRRLQTTRPRPGSSASAARGRPAGARPPGKGVTWSRSWAARVRAMGYSKWGRARGREESPRVGSPTLSRRVLPPSHLARIVVPYGAE
jgi:hypothetical protein